MRHLTTGEVARRCRVSVGTVKNWIEAGKLEAFRTPGRHFRIRASELRRLEAAFGFGAEADESPRILVVDDQQDFVDLVLDALKDLVRGARVEGACGGYEGLLKIGSFQPHLLVLDLRMPGLDGFEVCRREREAQGLLDADSVAVAPVSRRAKTDRARATHPAGKGRRPR